MNVKEQAEELIKSFRPFVKVWDCRNDVQLKDKNDIKCAIISTENTIKILQDIYSKSYNYTVLVVIQQQQYLLTELKSRL